MHELNHVGKRQPTLREVAMALANPGILAFASFWAVMCWTDVYQIGAGNIDGYPWGWEDGGWLYANPTNYMINSIGEGALSTVVLLSFLARKRWPWLFYGLAMVLLLPIVINVITI